MKPRILALDTAAEFGSIALLAGGEVVAEILLHSPEGFSAILFDRLRSLLESAAWKLEEVDCFAAAAGPGSFTGVRVGLAAAKGLAEAMGKAAVGVSSLQAVASFGTAALRAAVLDARRGQVYGGLYDSALDPVSPEVVAAFPDWLAKLPAAEIEFVSPDFAPYRGALAGTRFEDARITESPRALAGAVGRLAAARLRSGTAHDPAAIDANYVRRSDAELFWKE